MSIRTVSVLLTFLLLTIRSVIADDASELKELQGPWEVTELVEDGKVIPEMPFENGYLPAEKSKSTKTP